MSERTDIHALAGAYVLDAVDDIERASFDRHLRQCNACAVEVAELRETTARLAGAMAVPPPTRMRDAVLATVARTPQERPVSSGGKPAAVARWRRWSAGIAAAVVLAAGVGATTWVVADRQAREFSAQVQSVLGAPDARLVSAAEASADGRVTVIYAPSRDAAVAVLDGFAEPGDDRAYQLWMIGTEVRSVGLLSAGATGGTRYIDRVGDASAFAVSQERAGGAKTPSAQVAAVKLPR